MNSILTIVQLIRYRFFLFAGLFPYLLGQSAAFNTQKSFNWPIFYWGLLGIFLVLAGVELFNEYFDSQSGGDRVFTIEKPAIPKHFYVLGLLAFALAFCIGMYLTYLTGWWVLFFCFMGFLAAYFYVGPPFRWAYRGLGETVIALSYGPLMVLGSYYIQAKGIDIMPFYASLICGLSIFCLAILNEIPDYYQDKLVGKRNLVVKLGKQRAMVLLTLSLFCMFFLLILGISLKKIPILSIITFFMLPWVFKSLTVARKRYDDSKAFLSVINVNIVIYFVIIFSIGIGYSFLAM